LTTAAPSCALVTPSPGPLRGESQPTQCTYTGVWRGGLRPPSEPPVSRAAAGAPDGRGRSPRTPAAAPSWRSGAPLWSPPTSRRETSSPRRRPSGSPTSGSGPTRSSAASGSPGSMPSTASRTLRRPETAPAAASIRPRARCSPSRRDHSRRRRGLGTTPNPATKAAGKCGLQGCRAYDQGGVVPSPALRPKGGERIRRQAACQETPTFTQLGDIHFCARRVLSRGGVSGW